MKQKRQTALQQRYEWVLAAATLAAHATATHEGFRQRDLQFLVELFVDWLKESFSGPRPSIQRVHLLRHLRELHEMGLIRQTRHKTAPRYFLYRGGIVFSLEILTSSKNVETPEQVAFVSYFLATYAPIVKELMVKEGRQFPKALELEVNSLLDPVAYLNSHIAISRKNIRDLELRVSDGNGASQLSDALLRRGASRGEVAKAWEEQFPYSLNSLKPLEKLFAEIPAQIAEIEMGPGNRNRIDCIWSPALALQRRRVEFYEQIRGVLKKNNNS